jgi:hypothetical protein
LLVIDRFLKEIWIGRGPVGNTIVVHHLSAHFSGGCMVATAPSTSTAKYLYVVLEATPPEFQGLFSKFQEVVDQAAVTPPAKYKMVQYLCSDTEAFDEGMFCQFDAAKPAAIKQDFARLEKEGSIPRSSDSWLSPLHKMMKEDGTCRPCGDYQHLATKSDTCPLPNIQDKLAHMHG